MLVKQPQEKPHEDNHGGERETHDIPTPPQEPQREAETPKTARTVINAREKFECRKRPEKTDDDRQRRRRPRDAGGSGAAPFQNFPYVFVLFHNYDLFLCRMGRVCLASVSVGYISEGRNAHKISGQKNQPQLHCCG